MAKTKFVVTVPPLVQLVGKRRAGVRAGQVFRDKRRAARVSEKAAVRRLSREEA